MLMHLGDLSANGAGASQTYTPQSVNAAPLPAYTLLASAIALSPDPVILSPTHNICGGPIVFSDDHVGNMFSLIESLSQPVYMHVSLIPDTTRVSLTTAIADAQTQMAAIFAIFQGYGILPLLKGFCLDNVSQGFMYGDGSQWNREAFNQLIHYIHKTFMVGAAVIINPAIDALTIFAPPFRTPLGSTAFTQTPTALGTQPGCEDWLIHVNPIFTSQLCQRGAFSPDISRASGMLRVMAAMPNINHAVVQGFSFIDNTFTFDTVDNIEFTQVQLRVMHRTAYFLEALGVTNYYLCADQSYGAASDVVLHPGLYRPLASVASGSSFVINGSGVNNIYLASDINFIYVYRRVVGGTDQLIAQFDKQFAPITSTTVDTTIAPVFVYPFVGAFDEDVRDIAGYFELTPFTNTFDTIPINFRLCTEFTGVFPTDPVYDFADDPLANTFGVVFYSINVEDHLADTLEIGDPSNSVGPICLTYTNFNGSVTLPDIALSEVENTFGVEVYENTVDFIYQYPAPVSADIIDDPSSQ
jgi:hypothetical protein